VTRIAVRLLWLALLASLLPGAAQAQGRNDPILVPEVSQHNIVLQQGFTGTELLLYGAVLDPRGQRAGSGAEAAYDIVIVLKGPTEPIRLREKAQMAGIWVNAESTAYRSVPSFYALASSRPISDIVDPRTAAIYELGLQYLQLSPTGTIDPEEQQRFSAGLVDLRTREGLYGQYDGAVQTSQGVLYSARLPIPSNVRPGRYVAETFAIAKGRVIVSATSEVQVSKEGLERLVTTQAEDNGLLYGLFAIALSLFMGWAAGRIYSYV
jgi:uncharacterized protein (TIGR02186 family)